MEEGQVGNHPHWSSGNWQPCLQMDLFMIYATVWCMLQTMTTSKEAAPFHYCKSHYEILLFTLCNCQQRFKQRQ